MGASLAREIRRDVVPNLVPEVVCTSLWSAIVAGRLTGIKGWLCWTKVSRTASR